MVNGQEVKEVIEDQVVQNPVSQVIAVGTKKEEQPAPTPVPQTEPSHQVAKGTQEEGQALTQPTLPVAPVETELPRRSRKESVKPIKKKKKYTLERIFRNSICFIDFTRCGWILRLPLCRISFTTS